MICLSTMIKQLKITPQFKNMSLRDTVKEWIKEGKEFKVKNPLCSKRLVKKNLNQILSLLEDDSVYIAKERIKFLIDDIENGKLDAGEL